MHKSLSDSVRDSISSISSALGIPANTSTKNIKHAQKDFYSGTAIPIQDLPQIERLARGARMLTFFTSILNNIKYF